MVKYRLYLICVALNVPFVFSLLVWSLLIAALYPPPYIVLTVTDTSFSILVSLLPPPFVGFTSVFRRIHFFLALPFP